MGRSAAERREELVALYKEARGCTRCPLHETRTQVVFGNGNADADLMFVGEAPGFHEDQQGIPFVGRAGQLLDELLEEQGLDRDDVFVANVLKCRPPGNRDPQPDEIEACRPYLERQVELIEPRVICTLGNFATKLLTGSPHGHHARARRAAGARAGRADGAALPDLPPGGGPAHAGGQGAAARGLRQAAGAAGGAGRRSSRRPRRVTRTTSSATIGGWRARGSLTVPGTA